MNSFELIIVQLDTYEWQANLTAYPGVYGLGPSRGKACEALLLCIGDSLAETQRGEVTGERRVHMS